MSSLSINESRGPTEIHHISGLADLPLPVQLARLLEFLLRRIRRELLSEVL